MVDYSLTVASPGEPPLSMGALPEGAVVGRFEVVRVLGVTALGVDYRAVDRAGGAEVVIREYLPQRLGRRVGTLFQPFSARHADALARGLAAFKDESRTLMRVDHPSLVRVIDVLDAHGTAHQVTLHRGGTSLAQLRPLLREPPSEAALRALLDPLLSALEALHRHGIAHGAVTPEQILLMSRDRPLLLAPDPARADIAPALIAALMTDTERDFAASELLAPSPSRPIGPWTDLYGLAATLRCWIVGARPRPGAAAPGEAPEPMAAMLSRLEVDARYSAQLLGALDLALATEPGARPESVAQFRRALGSRPSLAPRPAWPAAVPLARPARPDAKPMSALPKRELPLDDFLRIHGPRQVVPPHTICARSTRHGRQRARWAGGTAALLVAASCAAWQLTQETPLDQPAQIVDSLLPTSWHRVTDTPGALAPVGPRDACEGRTPLAQCRRPSTSGRGD